MFGAQPALSASELALISDDLRAVFCCEVAELLTRIDATLALTKLAPKRAIADELGQILHTMKGAASAAGEIEVRDLVHALEDRTQALPQLDHDAAEALLATIRAELSRVRSKLDLPEISPLVRRTPDLFIEALERAAHEAARACGKQVQLVVHPDAGLDGTPLVVHLYEPLLHLLRNAVAHGIEPATERQARGKDVVGTIAIESNCDDGLGTIWVIDDGGGIDVEAVRRRAAERGIDLPTAEPLSSDRLLEILCQPGFSTHAQVDVVAGRGMGLPAVRRAIREQGGTLSLHSVAATGCIFTLEVPLNPVSK